MQAKKAVGRVRLVLADDHRLFLEGLRRLLEPEFDVVECVESGPALIEATDRQRPEIVVTDYSMPGLNGILATQKIKTAHPDIRVILLTMHDEAEYAVSALEAGASGYVLKHADPDEFRAAIRQVAAGQTYVPPAMASGVLAAIRSHGDAGRPELSERHLDILRHLAEGKTAKEIAVALGVSRKTVEYHKYRLAELLGVTTTAELIRYAVERGIVDR